jgi:hypothetical protein
MDRVYEYNTLYTSLIKRYTEGQLQQLVNNIPSVHVGDCKGFNGRHFPIPTVGGRLKVTGVYVQDIGEGGNTELHPVYKIETIPGGSSNISLSSVKDNG